MIIGIPKEIKNNENRVAITPAGVYSFVKDGHQVIVETNSGSGSSFSDEEYQQSGARIAYSAKEVWAESGLILKVKEPQQTEFQFFREGLILFTYLHLSAEPELTRALMECKVTALAYETVELNRTLPLLTPMSEVAGRMSVQIGAHLLEKPNGGAGILLGGVPGVKRGKVTIIGGGVVGTNAAKIAIGFGAEVTIVDLNADRLRQLDDQFGSSISTLISNPANLAESVAEADLVIGAVLIPGAKAPKLVTNEVIQRMRPGSVIVDVAIDQGGIFETIDRITTHANPTYEKYGIIHYAVANMPGAVPRTSTIALTNVTTPYALLIANVGLRQALINSLPLQSGLNVATGSITYKAIADEFGYDYKPVEKVLETL
ncbi:alanine dehydrogenase [Paenibacillus psychroresistens]|uniref:Alanine dehydrogenase n=1 Tax=Paenibacillus psychroresistens TaxID=1778678 RepID=A0A6B8RG76_9BACL|nr:alanine dehydrogenase [Paenibacillus psychroresistens]QGQ94428.1 alanine dehydrogenase [Paenibacillus psychroresistens]